jgi:glycosyltransferase involved in cell wall biosynthesis
MHPSADAGRTRVLILSQDLVGPRMAGPGIRYWELAHVLARTCAVTLAAPLSGETHSRAVSLAPLTLEDPAELTPLLQGADVVISSGFLPYNYPQLLEMDIPWVIDLYIPAPTEGLAFHSARPLPEQEQAHAANTAMQNRFLARGDFFLCANDRQRDLYVGLLAATGRLNPHTYGEDPTLRSLIACVPFGLAAEPPQHTRPVVKGVVAGIPTDGRLILWGGGMWDWLDSLTLVRAMARVARQRDDACLYFPGTRHPFKSRVPDMAMHARTVALADELGLTGRRVFFGDWLPNAERASYLLEADVGVSLHFPGVEARYAFRTRVLDYIWAGLPMVLSAGDSFAELVAERQLGLVVAPESPEEVADALLALLAEEDGRARRREAFARTAAELTWERVAAPLIAYCRAPRPAADRRAGYALAPPSAPPPTPALERQLAAARERCAALEDTLRAYQNGRFMRLMAWLQRLRRRLGGGERGR